MTKQMRKKVFNSLRLVIAGLLAVVAILGVAAASDILAARDASGAALTDPCDACQGDQCAVLGCPGGSGADGEAVVNETAQNILRALVWFGGAVAVIFVVVGGIQLATSEGDPAKVKKGRGTITFAIIGVIVAVLATFIVDEVVALFM
jgi:hypothetical protein